MPASITLTVAHLPTSTSFFLSALHPLNYIYRGRVNDTIGFGYPDTAPDFWITQSIPGVPPGPAHVAFPALSRAKVHEFFHTALKAGGKVHGEPALRDECGYYSAAILDVDGNSIEAVFRPDLLEASADDTGDGKSIVSMTKSTATKSRAPTTVSSAHKATSMAPSKAGSTAPSARSSRAPSRTASVSATEAAPVRTTISRVPTAPAAPQSSGTNFVDMMNEARGTVAFAREMVNHARPLMTGPAAGTAKSTPESHGPSDAIVGTLLGVAAGAALHYAFSNRTKSTESASASITPPGQHRAVAASESAPSWTEERYYYYHTNPQQRALPANSGASATPYAIEPPPSSASCASASRPGGQKLIEMIDNDPCLSDITSRPRRRSSFSGASVSRTTASRTKPGAKVLEGPPPTSYRGPTVITMASNSRSHHSQRSRASSTTRSTSRPADEGYASATEDRRSKAASSSSHSRRASSTSRHTTRPRSNSTTSNTTIRAIKIPTPSEIPLPASRAASHIDSPARDRDSDSFHSTRSRAHKTVIGRLTERQLHRLEDGGRLDKGHTDVTRSVIGKVKAVDKLDLELGRGELRPQDSVSQVSSVRSGRTR